MKKTTLLKRVFSAALALLLALAAAAAAEAPAEQTVSLKKYSDCGTIGALFRAAERALKDGGDPKLILDEMYAVAEEQKLQPYFQYALENAAARDSDLTGKLTDLVAGRELKPSWTSPRAAVDKIGFDAFGSFDGSGAFMEMIADPGARYCLSPGVWAEADFRKAYGTVFTDFRPSRPRPGYVCVVIEDGSETAPETSWQKESAAFLNIVRYNLSNVMSGIRYENVRMPLVTGNPDLASEFWVFRLSYPFRGWYGRNNRKEVRGFNCEISLTVTDAASGRNIAKCSAVNRLPNTIDWWHDGIAEADTPGLEDSKGYGAFVSKVAKAVDREDENAVAVRPMTPVSAESVLNGLLLKQAEKTSDPWMRAVYAAGARNIALKTDSVAFSLRSFDPRIKELGAYAKAADGNAWLNAALRNASGYDLALTLPTAGGMLTKQAEAALGAAVKKAAAAAKQGLAGKDMASALSGRLFPLPVEGKVTDAAALLSPRAAFTGWFESAGLAETGLTPEDLSLICYAQKSLTINAKTGPRALELICTGTEPAALIGNCAAAVTDSLAFVPASSRPAADQAAASLRGALKEAALKSHAKPAGKFTFSIDLDELADGGNPKGYLDLLAGYDLRGAAEKMLATAGKLPDEAAVPMPKAGKLTGPGSGTKVHFDLRADAGPTYVELRTFPGNKVAASAFVYPGRRVTLTVPAGYYRIAFCTGPYWYGADGLFSTAGQYYISESTQVLEAKYTHVYGLDPGDEFDILFFEASPEDFR